MEQWTRRSSTMQQLLDDGLLKMEEFHLIYKNEVYLQSMSKIKVALSRLSLRNEVCRNVIL
jgi:hypothetical protein